MATHYEVAKSFTGKRNTKTRGFNVWHNGATIFSYGEHFPIAHHTRDAHDRPCVMLTTRGYSVSTAKHIGIVWKALDYGTGVHTVYWVDDVLAKHKGEHEQNIAAMKAEAETLRDKATRARVHGDSYREQAQALEDRAEAYRAAFIKGE